MKLDLVLVVFNPNVSLLKEVLQSIAVQVRDVYIVDNSKEPARELRSLHYPNINYIELGENMGIAHAQNIGILKSIKNESDYVLLSDQDSIYPRNFVCNMFKGVEKDAAAISPLFNDTNCSSSSHGFVRKGLFGFKKFFPTSGKHIIFQTIASGCIIKSSYLDDIGLMNEKLFIDWVDIEWCWRATFKGYKLIGNADVVISHQLGDGSVNLGFREVNIRSPLRHYYITRNAIYLALYCKQLSVIHRCVFFLKSIRFLVGYPILSKPHFQHFMYTFRGFYHGVSRRLGKYK